MKEMLGGVGGERGYGVRNKEEPEKARGKFKRKLLRLTCHLGEV